MHREIKVFHAHHNVTNIIVSNIISRMMKFRLFVSLTSFQDLILESAIFMEWTEKNAIRNRQHADVTIRYDSKQLFVLVHLQPHLIRSY